MSRRSAKPNGIFGAIGRSIGGAVKTSHAVGKAKREYGRELKASRKQEAARGRRLEAERALKVRRGETAAHKRDEQARKAAEKREQQDRVKEEKRVQKERDQAYRAQQREVEKREREEERERDKEEAARRKEMLREQAERKREQQIEDRERAAIAKAEDRASDRYAGRMRRRPSYVQRDVDEMGHLYANPTRRKSKRTKRRNPPRRRGGVVDVVLEGVKGGAVAWGVEKAVNLLPLPQGQYARPLAKIGIGAAVAVYGERLPFVSPEAARVAGLIIIGTAAIEGFNALIAQSPLAQFPIIGNGQLNAGAAGVVGTLPGAFSYPTEAAGDAFDWDAVG